MTKYVDPDPKLKWPIAYSAVCEIAKSEGLRLVAYRCSAGVPTIARGRTQGVKMGDTCTLEEADKWFCEDLTTFADGVRAKLTRPASANELGALTSLAYNIGLGGFARSTVLRKHNEGDYQAAARAFALWNKAGGQVIPGLTARRAREAALYLTPDDGIETLPLPQAVEPESTLTQSPIAQSGVLSILGGVTAALTAVIDPIKDATDKLGLEPLVVIGAVAVIVGLIVIEQRRKQRTEGWA